MSLKSIVPTPRERPLFVEVDLSHYTCPVCKDVFKDCVQLPCGHKCCNSCVDELFPPDSTEDGQCPVQEEDCFKFSKSQVLPDYGTRRDILRLKVYCKFKENGCDKTVEWSKLENHCTSCDYRSVECPNKTYGCEEIVLYKNITDHVTNCCQFSPVVCEYCQEPVIRRDLQEHHENTCPQIQIPCKYHCDITKLPRQQMLQHYNNCPIKPAKCPYASAGCKFEGKESEVRDHEQKSFVEHLTLNQNYIQTLERQNIDVKEELQALRQEKDIWQSQISETKKDYDNLVQQFEWLKKDSAEFKIRVVSTVEKVFGMEELLRNVPTKQTTDHLGRELRSLKDSQESLERKLSDMDKRGLTGNGNSRNNTDPSNESLKKQIQNLEKQTAIQDIRLAELDLRFQILETASYDGILIWKIMDYSRRKNDAVSGRTYSLFSQPFYSGRFGYKMCGRVYLNGDGMGKGSHLSLFFVVMKGEHDALMPWPFQQNIQMALLDQHDGTQSITDSFRPDTSSSSFQRPTTDMNTAVGCPMFVSHSKLESRKYLKDDTIFIKVAVDRASLPHH